MWTRDLDRAERAAAELDCGYTWINSATKVYDELPFGGLKASGYGKEHGSEAFDYYTDKKSVVVETRMSYNASQIVDRHVESGRADKPAFIAADTTLTYEQLRARRSTGPASCCARSASAASTACCSSSTTRRPSRSLFLGAMRIGAVPVPVSHLDKADNFRHFVEDSYATVVVDRRGDAAAAAPRLAGQACATWSAATDGPGVVELDGGLAAQSDELDPAPTHRDDMAFWLYSSGSTGKPKGVVHLHHDIEFTCETYAGQVLGLREDDITFSTTKLFHAYGLGNGLSFPLWFGATSVLMRGRPTPAGDPRHAARAPPDHVLLGARALRPRWCATRRPTARSTPCACACRRPRRCRRRPSSAGSERFGLDIIDGIGSTEMLHIFCSNRPGAVEPRHHRPAGARATSCGIVDEAGQVLDGPAVGGLEVRGDSCAAFYWHQHEKTKCRHARRLVRHRRPLRAPRGRRLRLRGPHGRHAQDRRALGLADRHGARPDRAPAGEGRRRRGGHDRGCQPRRGLRRDATESGDEALAEELRAWCKERMRRYEYPHVVEFVDELPRTLSGKVQRFRLRELARA